MMKIQFKVAVFAAMMIFLFVTAGFAYSDNAHLNGIDITPTPAPSKTPTAAPTPSVSQTQSPTEIPVQPGPKLAKPFTQEDLTVLTGNIQRPNGLAWYDNKVYSSCSGDWTVYQIDLETGNTAQYIYGVKNAHTMYVTSEDDRVTLWIPDFQNNTLTHIVQGTADIVASNLKGPWGIAPLNDSEFAVTNLLGNNLVSISGSGEIKEMIDNLRSPAGVALDSENLYVANTGSARRAIEWFSLSDVEGHDEPIDSSDQTLNASLVTGLQNVTDLAMASDGYLYFSYALGTRGVVGRVDPKLCREHGGCTNDQVEIVLYSELAAPLAGLIVSPDMRLYVHSIFSPDIYWLQLDSNVSDPQT